MIKSRKKNYVHVLSFRFDISHTCISPYKNTKSFQWYIKYYIAEEPISIQCFHCHREKLSLKMCTEVVNFIVSVVYLLEAIQFFYNVFLVYR